MQSEEIQNIDQSIEQAAKDEWFTVEYWRERFEGLIEDLPRNWQGLLKNRFPEKYNNFEAPAMMKLVRVSKADLVPTRRVTLDVEIMLKELKAEQESRKNS